jgi:hypothetical protein
MAKITKEQVNALDKLLDSPATLKQLGAALVHSMKDQMIPGMEIDKITLPVVESVRESLLSPIADSIDVSVNSVVSVGWSKDLDRIAINDINTRMKGVSKAQAQKVLKTTFPKGIEGGKRIILKK